MKKVQILYTFETVKISVKSMLLFEVCSKQPPYLQIILIQNLLDFIKLQVPIEHFLCH